MTRSPSVRYFQILTFSENRLLVPAFSNTADGQRGTPRRPSADGVTRLPSPLPYVFHLQGIAPKLLTHSRAPPTAIATASAPCYITSGNGGCTALLISLLIFAITLFFILWRPRGIREAWFAAGGAALMGAAGFVGWSDVVRLWAETG